MWHLGVGVEGVAEHRHRVQGLHEIPDVGALGLVEGGLPAVHLGAGVVAHAALWDKGSMEQ